MLLDITMQVLPPVPVLARSFVANWDRPVFALHDYQTAEAGREPYEPRAAATQTEVPETLHLAPQDHLETMPMDREMQEFYLATLRIPYPQLTRDEAILRWHELGRTSVAFTDGGLSWDKGNADYLFDPTSTLPPMGWKISIACCGNAFKLISGRTIEAIDYRVRPLPDPVRLYQSKPWLFFWATQCYMQKTGALEMIDGAMRKQYMVSRFPQFRPVGTLLPLMGTDGMTRFAETWRMKPIAPGTIYSPYVEQI